MRPHWVLVLAGCGRISFGSPDPAVDGGRANDAASDVATDVASDVAVACAAVAHDEDSDGVDDGCDRCPYVAGGQPDGDGDGIGDACDPLPSAATERFARFETFAAMPPDWTFSSTGVWTADALDVDARAMSWAGWYLYAPMRERFVLGGRLGARGVGSQHILAVLLYQGPGKYYCQIREDAGGAALEATFTLDGNTFSTVAAVPIPSAGSSFVLVVDHELPDLRCMLVLDGVTYLASGSPIPVAADRVAINVIDEAVRLEYFTHISTAE
jgi:hypothetical protein